MTLNFYVMPIVGAGTFADPRKAKYASTFAGFTARWFDYGNEPWCLVGIIDIDGTTDTALTANSDVFAIPPSGFGMDQSLTLAQRNAVSTRLETVDIPGTWVVAGTTWRDVVLFVGAVCQYAQRYQGGECEGRWFAGAVTLDTTFGSLSSTIRTCFQAAVTHAGWLTPAGDIWVLDTSGITGSSTLRQVIRSFGQQYVASQVELQIQGISLYTA